MRGEKEGSHKNKSNSNEKKPATRNATPCSHLKNPPAAVFLLSYNEKWSKTTGIKNSFSGFFSFFGYLNQTNQINRINLKVF